MLRRAFAQAAMAFAFAKVAFSQSDNETLDDLTEQLSKHDIVHFGEEHPLTARQEKTPREEFALAFMPRFATASEPYDTFWCEFVPAGTVDGELVVPDEEWDRLDTYGEISREHTPTIYQIYKVEVTLLDPEGTDAMIKTAHQLGIKVRGYHPTRKINRYQRSTERALKDLLEGTVDLKGQSLAKMIKAFEADLQERTAEAINGSFMELASPGLDDGRVLIYGGAAHNDASALGIAKQMRATYGDRYATVDIVKPCYLDEKTSFYLPILQALSARSDVDLLDPPHVLTVRSNSSIFSMVADYMVIFPND